MNGVRVGEQAQMWLMGKGDPQIGDFGSFYSTKITIEPADAFFVELLGKLLLVTPLRRPPSGSGKMTAEALYEGQKIYGHTTVIVR